MFGILLENFVQI